MMVPSNALKQHARMDSVPPSTPMTIGTLACCCCGEDDANTRVVYVQRRRNVVVIRRIMFCVILVHVV